MTLVEIKPPQIAWVSLGLAVGLHFLLPPAYRGSFSCMFCGVVGIAAGFGLMTWAWALFRRADTPIRPTDRAVTLVRSGPFRFSRNPMYLGIVIMLLGVAVWVGSYPMLLAPIGFFAFMSVVFVPFEERRMEEVFGEPYRDYARSVRRWI